MNNSNDNRHARRPNNNRNRNNGKPRRDGQRRGRPAGNGFSRPGPFGFKPKPISESQQMVANPFGFASHNKGSDVPQSGNSGRDQSQQNHQNRQQNHQQNQHRDNRRPYNNKNNNGGNRRPYKNKLRKPRRNPNNINRDGNNNSSNETLKAPEPPTTGE